MFNKIRSWFKKPEVDVPVDYRHDFKLDGVRAYTDIEAWEPEKRGSFFIECKKLLESEALRVVIDNEMQDLAAHAFMQSDTTSLFFDRGKAGGVKSIREKLEGYAARIEQEENFDSGDYIPQE